MRAARLHASAQVVSRLSRRPLVPVGAQLVRPNCLFQSVQLAFPPFIVEVPRAFGAFDELLLLVWCTGAVFGTSLL